MNLVEVSRVDTRLATISIQLYSEIDSPRSIIFCPGEYITGKVCINFHQQTFIRGAWIKLSGSSVINSKINTLAFDVLQNEDEYYCGGIHDILIGLGEEKTIDYDNLLDIPIGEHSFSFSILIPDKGTILMKLNKIFSNSLYFSNIAIAPLSYIDENCELLYTLTAFLDTPSLSTSVTNTFYNLQIGTVPSYDNSLPPNLLGTNHTPLISSCSDCKNDRRGMSLYNFSEIFTSCLALPTYLEIKSLCGPFIFDYRNSSNILKFQYIIKGCNASSKLKVKTDLYVLFGLKQSDFGKNKSVNENIVQKYNLFTEYSIPKLSENGAVEFSENVSLPIVINDSKRRLCFLEWPKPIVDPTFHKETISNFTVDNGLFHYKVFLKVSVQHESKYKLTQTLPSCTAEIFIKPPQKLCNFQSPKKSIKNVMVSKCSVIPRTPLAVPAVLNVRAEVVSRGPAAILGERNTRNNIIRTPNRLVCMYKIISDPVVLSCTPQYSPPTVDICSPSKKLDNDENDDSIINSSLYWTTPCHILGINDRNHDEFRNPSPIPSRPISAQLFNL